MRDAAAGPTRHSPASETVDAPSALAVSADLACAELDQSARIVHRWLAHHHPHEAVTITADGASAPLSQWGRSAGGPTVAVGGEAAGSSVTIRVVLAGRRAALSSAIEGALRALARVIAARVGRARVPTDTAQLSLAHAVAAERERLTHELTHHFAQQLETILGHLRGAVTDDVAGRALSATTAASLALADLRGRRPEWRQARTVGEAFAATEREVGDIARAAELVLECTSAVPSEQLVANTVLDAACWITRAAVLNVAQHAHAARVRVSWSMQNDKLVAAVVDDGRGFDASRAALGDLRGMRRRAELLGGALEIESEPGWGTLVRASVGLRAANPVQVDESASALVGALGERELDVLRLMAVGHRNRDIAVELELSQHTVKFHITKIFEKLGVRTRAEAAAVAFAAGIHPRPMPVSAATGA
jgi:DNA-binding CsgD family transcriptional regulator/signal transduction histidine kinase